MEELIFYYNGNYMKESEVRVPITDVGFRQGYAVFDFERTYNHVPFFWEEHVDRLYRSLRAVHIDPGLTPKEMLNITHEVFERNKKCLEPEDDFGLTQCVTKGTSPGFNQPPLRPNVFVFCEQLKGLYEQQAKWYQEGVHLVLVSTRQIPPQCLDVRVKSHSRLHYCLAMYEGRLIDPEGWPLMLDINGYVAEGVPFNVFIVKDGKLFTPRPHNILVSITRNTIVRLAKELGIDCAETDLCVYELDNADEIFLTHTRTTIIPVAKFNGRVLQPIPGPRTQQLCSAFSKLVGVDIVQRPINYVQAKGKATK